jgi:hypothetical protein
MAVSRWPPLLSWKLNDDALGYGTRKCVDNYLRTFEDTGKRAYRRRSRGSQGQDPQIMQQGIHWYTAICL